MLLEIVRVSVHRVWIAACVFALLYSNAVAQLNSRDPMPPLVEPDPDRLVSAVLHEVIDGDSVELFIDGDIVRYELAGADAPDIVDQSEIPIFGSVEAKQRLLSYLDGEQLAVIQDKQRPTDVQGRKRGYIYRMPDMLLVNLEMVRQGMCKHARDSGGFNEARFLWAQKRARNARKGVWASRPKPIPQPAESEPEIVDRTDPKPDDHQDNNENFSTNPNGELVYVTQYGSKYHRKDCQHVRDGGNGVNRDDVKDSHKPCKVCNPDENESD